MKTKSTTVATSLALGGLLLAFVGAYYEERYSYQTESSEPPPGYVIKPDGDRYMALTPEGRELYFRDDESTNTFGPKTRQRALYLTWYNYNNRRK